MNYMRPRSACAVARIEFDADGEPVNKWARKDGAGWYEPPVEIVPLLDLVNPRLIWAPIQGEFRLELVAPLAGLRIFLRADAPVELWRRALCAMAEWNKSAGV